MAFEISELVAQPNFAPKPWQTQAPDPLGGHRPAVTGSPDLARVLALARRPAFDAAAPESAALARAVTARLRRTPQPLVCTCRTEHKSDCLTELREVQAAALYDLALCNGALHPIGVGHGKTLLDLLAPLVVPDCRVALLLIPPTLVGQLVNEYRLLSQHFIVPALVTHATVEYTDLEPSTRGLPVLHVLPYSRLSRPEATTWIEGLGPDLIIADECFPPGTPVQMADGTVRAIEAVQPGDIALSRAANGSLVPQRVLRRISKVNHEPLVRVEHDCGVLICTASHHVWTSNRGYTRAGDLRAGDRLGWYGSADLPEVPARIPDASSRQDDGAVLLEVVRREPRAEGEEAAEHRSGEASQADGRAGLPGSSRGSRCEAQGSDVPRPGRQRDEHAAADIALEADAITDGVGHPNASGARTLPQSAGFVQGRLGGAVGAACDRDRRSVALHAEVAVPRSSQDGDLACSRVVGVTVLERGGSLGSGDGVGDDLVYDLEVEDTHCYFASGVLVHNCDKLRDPGTATTSRVLRYFRAHPEARFAGWTGSLTESSVEDYAHLSALALREGSPLPIDPEVAKEWATALDPDGRPAPAGALLALCDPGEHVADGFHRRLVETPGVIATDTSAVECALAIEERDPGMIPHEIERLLLDLRATWTRPDGEELVDAMAVAACARQLASGFYYRWRFPRGETVEQILLWLEARKSWHRELRDKLRDRSEHLDSPLLCTRAARRAWGDEPIVEAEWVEVERYDEDGLPIYDAEGRPVTRLERQRAGNAHLPRWKAYSWPKWRDVRGTVAPETEAVLVDDYLARDAAAWAVEHRGIVWYEHGAFGRWVADIGGLALHGGGAGAGEAIAGEDGSRSIVCSIHAHGRGRDGLQKIFSEQLVANPPSSASRWEQLLGRLHRIRQKAPVVSTWFYRHTEETAAHVSKALNRALYVQRTLGATQKLRVGFNL